MNRITFLLVAVATLCGAALFTTTKYHRATAQEAAPIFVTKIPAGYRDWRFISVAHEEGELNDIRTILGTIQQSRPIGKESCRSRKAQSSPE